MFVRWNLDVFFPRFLLQLNPKIASSTLDGWLLFSFSILAVVVCKCVQGMCLVAEVWNYSFPDARDSHTFLLSWVQYWIKCLTSVRLQSFTRSIVQLISFLSRPLRFSNRKLCKDQVLDYWMCSYFRLQNENNYVKF